MDSAYFVTVGINYTMFISHVNNDFGHCCLSLDNPFLSTHKIPYKSAFLRKQKLN